METAFKTIGAFCVMVVAVIGLINAVGPRPTPSPTSVPTTAPITLPPPPVSVDPGGGSTRAVPNLVGLDTSEAINRLRDDGFQWRTGGFEASTSVPFGAVTRTDPPANTQITKGAPVTLYISNGPPH